MMKDNKKNDDIVQWTEDVDDGIVYITSIEAKAIKIFFAIAAFLHAEVFKHRKRYSFKS